MANISYIYGFAGADEMYRIVRYQRIDMTTIKTSELKNEIRYMWAMNPNIQSMYLLTSEPWMGQDVGDMLHRPTVDKCYAFYDYAVNNGLCLMKKKGKAQA